MNATWLTCVAAAPAYQTRILPRYHFIVYDGLNLRDPHSTELPDLPIAQIEAARLAGELLQDNARGFCELRTWQIEVLNEDGLVVFRIDLTASQAQQKQTPENYQPPPAEHSRQDPALAPSPLVEALAESRCIGALSAPMETELYQPVKRFLEGLGFQVKGEIGGCDLVGLRGDEPQIVIIGELKLTFNLELVLQAVDRAAACDEVWLAVRAGPNGRGRENDRRVRKLCRRLGVGLLVVYARGGVEIVVSPDDPLPRRDLKRRSRLTAEHQKRRGDPTLGGGCRQPIMTAYRQEALACASALCRGPLRVRDVKVSVPDAPKILQGNVYGWFVREARGVYALTERGRAALDNWSAIAHPNAFEQRA